MINIKHYFEQMLALIFIVVSILEADIAQVLTLISVF